MAYDALEAFLGNLRSAQQGFKTGGEGFEEASQSDARRALAEQAAQQDPENAEIIRQAMKAGDMSLVRDLIANRTKPKTPAPTGPTGQELIDLGLADAKTAPILDKVDPSQRRQWASASTNAGRQNKELDIKYGDAALRAERPARQDIKDFRTEFAKLDKEFDAKDLKYKNVQESMAKGTLPADAIVFNFLARDVAGEKGPLSDSDINRFASRAFGGDVQKAQNFLSGKTTSALTPEQRLAFGELVNQAANNYEGFKDEVIQNNLKNSFVDYRSLNKKGIDPSIAERAKKYGYKIGKGQEGSYELIKEQAATRTKVTGNGEASLFKTADSIKNPTVKAQVLEALKYSADNKTPVSDELRKMIESAAGAQ